MAVSEPETFITRIGRLFKRPAKPNGDSATLTEDNHESGSPSETTELADTRSTLIRPWSRPNPAVSQMQEGFQTLTELMTAIRQGLESQGQRQEQLLQHLSALPRVLEAIPESNRLQGEQLKAMHEQMVNQAGQQQVLGEILGKMNDTSSGQKEVLEGLRERVESLGEQDKAMTASLNQVSAAMESASRNSAAGTEVLASLRDNLKSRDTDLEGVLQRQGTKFSQMLVVAIFISIVAMMGVVVMGYLVWTSVHH